MLTRLGVVMALLAMVSFTTNGCMRAVDMAPAEVASRPEWQGQYQIRTTDDRFLVRQFQVTDSTLVILRLNGADGKYGRLKLPAALPINNVRTVASLETDPMKTGFAIVGAIGLVAAIILLIVTSTEDEQVRLD